MRIAVWHNLPSGGANRAMHAHVRGLAGRGHHIEIWHPPTANNQYLPLGDVAQQHCVPMEVGASASKRIPLGGLWEARSLLRALDAHCKACAKEIESGRFDLLFSQEAMWVPAPPLPQYLSIPTVLFMQQPSRRNFEQTNTPGTLPWIGAEMFENHAWRRPRVVLGSISKQYTVRLTAYYENKWARSFHRTLANSCFSRENILKAYGVDAKVCYLGVDSSKFRELRLPRERFVVGVGEIAPHKNIVMAVRAIAQLDQPRPPLVWIGNRVELWYRRELEALAAQLGVDLRLKDKITDQELVETLNRAMAMVYAPRLEPFGLAPLEANACGTPVVGIAEGGVRETVVDGVNGLLVEPDEKAIAEGLRRLEKDATLIERLRDGGREMIRQKWTHEASVDRLEHRLLEAIEECRPSVA